MRVLFLIAVAMMGLGVGFALGFRIWGYRAARAQHLEQRMRETRDECARVTRENAELKRRLTQVSNEQERLFGANEQLRRQRAAACLRQEGTSPTPTPQ